MKKPVDFDVNLCWHPTDDPHRVVAWMQETLNSDATLAIDTETSGVDWKTDTLRLVQFGTPAGGWALPAAGFGRLIEYLLEMVRSAEKDVVLHNSPFDLHFMTEAGYPVPDWTNVQDTYALHHLIQSNAPHGLKRIAGQTFGGWAYAGQGALKQAMKDNKWTWGSVPLDLPEYWAYGVMDTCLTAMVWDHYLPLLPDRAAYEREMFYQSLMFRAEERGVAVDLGYTENLRASYLFRAQELRDNLHDLGISNPNSNRIVAGALASLGYEPDAWTETGEVQVDKAVLSRVCDLGGMPGKAAEMLIEYKRLTGWDTKYLQKFTESGGRVHPSIRTLGARTGRSSITDPPLQQLPARAGADIRNCIVPDRRHSLVSIDYAGQEARLFAHYAQEPEMLRFFNEGDGDLHSFVADLVGVPRFAAKTINFALLFGAGPAKMAEQAGVTTGEMQGFLRQYHDTFTRVEPTMRAIERAGGERLRAGHGAYVTTWGGRNVYADDDKLYTLTNYLIQGSAADVTKQAAVNLAAVGLEDYLVLPVHDEFLFQFPDKEAEDLTRAAKAAMIYEDTFRCPLPVDASEPVKRWGEAK